MQGANAPQGGHGMAWCRMVVQGMHTAEGEHEALEEVGGPKLVIVQARTLGKQAHHRQAVHGGVRAGSRPLPCRHTMVHCLVLCGRRGPGALALSGSRWHRLRGSACCVQRSNECLKRRPALGGSIIHFFFQC